MPKYRSFTEYLQDNYYYQIKESLLEFVKENGLRNEDSQLIKYDDFDIVSLKIYRVNFTKSECSNVEFDFYLKAMFLVNNGFDRTVDSFVGTMAGSFSKGFKEKDNVDVTDDNQCEGVFTNALVPVMRKDDYDRFATNFLKQFYPEALETPMKFDIAKVAKSNGLCYYSAPLEDDILGVTYFADDKAEVYDKETGEIKLIDVHPGTVLISLDKIEERGMAVTRNTFVHEAVHWFFHRNYFELQQLLDSERTRTVCYRGASYYTNSEIEWMEKQARALTPRILMPKKPFLQKYRDVKEEVENCEEYNDKIKVISEIIIRLAKFFGVSKESVKYRLIDLGIRTSSGVFNYIDGEYLKPFTFKYNFLKDHQTFILSYQSYSRLMENNPSIRQAVLEQKLIYVNGMLVANNPKYVKITGKRCSLTDYALNNAHECALVFNIYHDFDDTLKSKDKCFFLFSSTHHTNLNASVSEDQLYAVLNNVDENNLHFLNHRNKIPSDFVGTLKYHMDKCHFNKQDLSYESDINEKYISQITNGKRNPTKMEVIKMSLAMKLSYPYLTDMLSKADVGQLSSSGSDNAALLTCLLVNGRRGLEEAYKMLKSIGRECLLDLSKKYIEERNL